MKEIDRIVAAKAAEVRNAMIENGQDGYYFFDIKVYGRVQDGDSTNPCGQGFGSYLTYTVKSSEHDSDKVEGDDADAVVKEFVRRKEWDKRHAYVVIPHVKEVEAI